jgi:hypothetical protein
METIQENGTTTLQVVTPDSLYLITKAEVDMQISTAKAFPRSLREFLLKAMSMATLNEDIAASCSYALPREGKSLEGPSVRLAEIVASAYGNIRSGFRVVSNDGKKITAQGYCHDLETNNFVALEVSRRITKKNGQTFSDDMQIVTGNAAGKIAYRNAVFTVVPAALVADIYERAKEVAKGTAETLIKRRDKALEYFRLLKVTDKQICEVLELKKVEDIDLDKLAILTGMRAAIKNGETTVQLLFETSKEEIEIEDLELLFEMKKAQLTDEEKTNGERIIKNKEAASYKKLKTLLSSK